MADDGRGRDATKPSEITRRGWWDIAVRVKDRISRDRLATISAGTAFFMLLALFPAMAAFVSLYGLIADPSVIGEHVEALGTLVPVEVLTLIREQLDRLVSESSGSLSFGFVIGLLAALWSANNGVKNLRVAMNVAYQEREHRSFLKLTLVTLAITIAAMVAGLILLVGLAVLPGLLATIGIAEAVGQILSFLRWPLLLAVVIVGLSLLYRYGPSRTPAKWRWISWGSAIAGVGFVAASLGFSWYLSNFANYNATYGSLGAAIGLLMWAWLSMFVIILGAEIDAEIEHQTEKDSTVNAPKPMGERGAYVADNVGPTAEEMKEAREGHAAG